MELPISSQSISVKSSHPILIIRTTDGYEIQSEGVITITSESGASWQGDVEETDIRQFPIWGSVNGVIESAFVNEEGNMKTTFESGCVIEFHPDAEYESWSVTGPGDYRMVCMPGGELAIWSPGIQ
ncbi:DUF6188 family protein [Nocardia donostiensis]|uniref:DUF6188 family protein n=1 Tax=Nocardia donostiensis TaxID=1538463 RepID=UPI0011155D47|nr:DUF6188 family protein [Nocardia donostiensis]